MVYKYPHHHNNDPHQVCAFLIFMNLVLDLQKHTIENESSIHRMVTFLDTWKLASATGLYEQKFYHLASFTEFWRKLDELPVQKGACW